MVMFKKQLRMRLGTRIEMKQSTNYPIPVLRIYKASHCHVGAKRENELPCKFSESHLEFSGLMWLSHHHERDFLDCVTFDPFIFKRI
jgi:hypothetical protein